MADGYFPTLISKDKDPNIVTNPVWVELTDGTSAVTITGGSLSVLVSNGSGASAVNIQDGGNAITVDAVNLDIRDLAFANDKVDASGSTLGANSGVDIGDVTINNGAGVAAVNIQDGGNAITVDAIDLDIRNLTLAQDAVQISANSTANSAVNPIYVSFSVGAITGEVHNYNDASVGANTSGNHDYTVTTAMLVKSIECASSGAAKFELLTGPVASLVAKWTGLIPKQGGSISVRFDPPIEVPVTSTGTVRVIRNNRENQAQSLYTTIVGIDA